jgi:hypothetical protein
MKYEQCEVGEETDVLKSSLGQRISENNGLGEREP